MQIVKKGTMVKVVDFPSMELDKPFGSKIGFTNRDCDFSIKNNTVAVCFDPAEPEKEHVFYIGDLLIADAQKPVDIRNQHHYARFKIQPVVFIMANNLNYEQGAIIKYIMRYDEKNGLEDLEKAKHYLDMMIQKVKGEDIKP